MTHGVRCTLVEPRPLRLDKAQHKLLKREGIAAEITRAAPPRGAPGCVGGGAAGAGVPNAANGGSGGGGAAGGGGGDEEEEAWWREDEQLLDEEEEEPAAGGGGDGSGSGGRGRGAAAAAEAALEALRDAEAAATVEQRLPWLAAMRAAGGADGSGSGKEAQTAAAAAAEGAAAEGVTAAQGGAADGKQQPSRTVALRQLQCFFGPDLWASPWWAAHGVPAPSLVVGQHPDEATELVVDYAAAAGAPFAVVPCCVFPRRFAWRRHTRADGTEAPVVTYPELVAYLLQKAARRGAREAALPFEGCNRVVFCGGGGGGGGGSVGGGGGGGGAEAV